MSVATLNDDEIISGSLDNSVKVWDIKTQNNTATLLGHSSYVYSVTKLLNYDMIVSGSFDKSIKIWEKKNKNF
jgi:WD40 repeat protein